MNVPEGNDGAFLDPSATRDYRSTVGSIGHVAGELRPDVAFGYSGLSRSKQAPTIHHARQANACVSYLQENRVVLR